MMDAEAKFLFIKHLKRLNHRAYYCIYYTEISEIKIMFFIFKKYFRTKLIYRNIEQYFVRSS